MKQNDRLTEFLLDNQPRNFTRQRMQTYNSRDTNLYPSIHSIKVDFTVSKVGKNNIQSQHLRGNKNIMDIINDREIIPEVLIIEKIQEFTEHGNFWSIFDSNLNQKLSVPRKPNKMDKD